jgi:hypothetical protein
MVRPFDMPRPVTRMVLGVEVEVEEVVAVEDLRHWRVWTVWEM